ncbi:MAG: CoA ester lyase [Nitriliruptoraceae bacterium]
MASSPRPRRTALYLPGENARALEKAAGLPADVVVLDLEDSVTPEAKGAARRRVAEAVRAEGFGHREVLVRVNGLETPWFHDDMAAIAPTGPDGILVPKVSRPSDVHAVEDALDLAAPPADTMLWAMLETSRAVLDATSLVSASSRLVGFMLGTNDLARELRAVHVPGRGPLLPAIAWCLLAVRDAGKVVIDGVFNDLDDHDGFAAECQQARELGFDGKSVIHPRQLEVANAAFTPGAEEVEHAREVIAAFDEATTAGRGVVTVRGRLVENLHVEEARRLLALAERISARPG